MKKLTKLLTALLAAALLVIPFATGCESASSEKKIVVGASSTPHAEILEFVKDDLKAKGYELEIKIYDDYILPNTQLQAGDLDANYFQHTPYLNDFNAKNNTTLVSVGKIHYEPLSVYGNGVTKEEFNETKTGRTIFIPSDNTNGTRALLVLEENGYLTLPEGTSPENPISEKEIVDRNGNTVIAVEAAQVAAQLKNNAGAIAVINGNYALAAGYSAADALAVESATGIAANLYANVVAVKEGNENTEKTKALVEVLTTKKVYDWIAAQYGGAVLPVFAYAE